MLVYSNDKNGKQYTLQTSSMPSFCNGIFFEFGESHEERLVSKAGKRSPYGRLPAVTPKPNVQRIRAAAIDYFGRQGVVIGSPESVRLLDLSTGEASESYELLKVEAGKEHIATLLLAKHRIKVHGLEAMVKKSNKPCAGRINKSASRIATRNPFKTTFKDIHSLYKSVLEDPTYPYNFINYAEAPFDGTGLFNKTMKVNWDDMYGRRWSSMRFYPSWVSYVPGLFNGSSLVPNTEHRVYATKLNPMSDMYASSATESTPLSITDDDNAWRWTMSTLADNLQHMPKARMLVFTDNTNWHINDFHTGRSIRQAMLRNINGEEYGVANDGTRVYFKVVPYYVGNLNHNDHNTCVMFVSLSPITLTNITKGKKK